MGGEKIPTTCLNRVATIRIDDLKVAKLWAGGGSSASPLSNEQNSPAQGCARSIVREDLSALPRSNPTPITARVGAVLVLDEAWRYIIAA
jgi:hypothetical protein